jgi:NAD(P)-dependent dehydrogenase (short-subunit alcohol dehydrogenase family)
MKTLEGKVAVVAGATRGAGRGIACALGEAGATVYCTGRSVRGRPPQEGVYKGRPETIEETAEMVGARGGRGVAVRTDHLDEEEVASLFARVRREEGRLDVLVNDISEGVLHDWKPFWQVSTEKGFRALRQGVNTHITTSRHAAPLLVETGGGLVVEVGDGDTLGYRGNVFYDLVKTCVNRLAWVMAEELYEHGVAAVAVTPGYMRTEYLLDHFGVTEQSWRDAAKKEPSLLASETPFYVGRAVAALASDPRVLEKSGGLYSSWGLAREYGFTDVDGARPDLSAHFGADFGETVAGATRTGFRWRLVRVAAGQGDGPTAAKGRRVKKSGGERKAKVGGVKKGGSAKKSGSAKKNGGAKQNGSVGKSGGVKKGGRG